MGNDLSESVVIEKKSSEEKDSDKGKNMSVDGEEDGLPMTMDCQEESYAYQSSGDESQSEKINHTYLRQQQKGYADQSESADLLNEAQINSKPLKMSVLDQLENFWEESDANKGKKGILAEHIMAKQASSQAEDLMNGGEAKGKGAFCI